MADVRQQTLSPIYIVSGGHGTSGEQVANTALAQFPDAAVPVIAIPNVRTLEQVEDAVARAGAHGGTLVHTLVDDTLRRRLAELAGERGVPAIDLMGPLLDRLIVITGQPPLGQPGLYRQLRRTYFDRVAAIEYTIAHDDGQKRADWPEADVVLVGVSRTGKTPLSIYLSVLGYKVANEPIVPGRPVPEELFGLEPKRVIGLTIDLERLIGVRRQRSSKLGAPAQWAYADPSGVVDELQTAQRIFRRGGFAVLDVTDKTVEATADEIIRRISRPA